jgi:quercetin dioxygenase-like cupin family protein
VFSKSNSEGYQEKLKGILLKTLTYGEKTILTNIKLAKDAIIPLHQHMSEQTGFLISGKLDFTIDGQHILAEPGDSWTIMGNVSHGATALEDTDVIEAFAPIREDYLP